MKRHTPTAAVATLLLLAATACIKNDIPYPRLQAGFTSIEAEGQTQAASLDSLNRTVTFFLDESVDIEHVRVTECTLAPAGAVWADSAAYAEGVNLRRPRVTVVSLYQEYEWTVSAVQEIARTFAVVGQVGAATIDVPGRRVIATVPETADLTALRVTALKLAGPTATYLPDIVDTEVDFTAPVRIVVTEHGRAEEWTIHIETTESTVAIERVDAWTGIAWAYASVQEERRNRYEYRSCDDEGNPVGEWQELPAEQTTVAAGVMTGRITGLQPLSTYEVRAISDDEASPAVQFTTEDTYTLPNGSMDNWWLDGKVWCPWPQDGQRYWDTGNKGATTLGQSNSVPTDDTSSGTGQAAMLETRFIGLGPIGKLAAGNIFIGEYYKTDGTNGILHMGQPFSLHPTKVRGYLKYRTAPVSHTTAGYEHLKDRPDTCVVWCALIDTPEPFEIRTNPNNRQLLDPTAPYIVAYGKVEYGYDIDNYIPFEFDLEYRDTSRRPTYILMTASASKLGDFFTGGAGAVLWVDDISLAFD